MSCGTIQVDDDEQKIADQRQKVFQLLHIEQMTGLTSCSISWRSNNRNQCNLTNGTKLVTMVLSVLGAEDLIDLSSPNLRVLKMIMFVDNIVVRK